IRITFGHEALRLLEEQGHALCAILEIHRSRRDDIPTFLAVTLTPVRMTTAPRNIRTRLATSLSVLLVLSTAINPEVAVSGRVRRQGLGAHQRCDACRRE